MSPTFFTTNDGDVILRANPESGSKHDFRVHRFILSLASTVFKDMFSFPQPPDENQKEPHGIPAVDVPDSPEVLDVILRFIYPGVEPPKFTDLSILSGLLSAADKYNIVSMQPVLRDALKTFIPNEPFRVYILACRFGFLEEAKAAAKASTLGNMVLKEDHGKEVRHVSNIDLYRLICFVREREKFARSEIMDFASMQLDWIYNGCEVRKHWLGDASDFYEKLGEKLLGVFTEAPHVQLNDFNQVLDKLPDPPVGCEPRPFDPDDDFNDAIECPLRPSFIRESLAILVGRLDTQSNNLLAEAFCKEF